MAKANSMFSVLQKVKVQLSLCISWRHMGCGDTAPLIPNHRTRWEEGLASCFFTSRTSLSPIGWAPEKNPMPIPGIKPQFCGCSALYWLCRPSSSTFFIHVFLILFCQVKFSPIATGRWYHMSEINFCFLPSQYLWFGLLFLCGVINFDYSLCPGSRL